jgi:glyoxylase-like metal-dependent hydrolase (beta-lactamase superfamily II)
MEHTGTHYTGDVAVGGPPQVRSLSTLVITKLAVGPYDNNAYLLRCRSTGDQLLVDAAAEPERLLELAGPAGLVAVVTTHRHADHWQGLADVVSATGARTFAHVDDADGIPVETDVLVAHGDVVMVGDVPLGVVHLRGHTPGSVALRHRDPDGTDHVFTGDSLFPGGVGKTTPDTFPQLMDDVEQRVFGVMADDTWFYPGHGKDSTLGTERPHLEEWRRRGW